MKPKARLKMETYLIIPIIFMIILINHPNSFGEAHSPRLPSRHSSFLAADGRAIMDKRNSIRESNKS